ncbi:SGNH/GDSL hydrolase family protein [Nostocoides vanveenii]|uniref:SGNH hydrolase-type esterase domain-containing protein n=1 Tax=Nostocoides vanveenii TaxID=330835 RepID=A0ABN2JZ10_9MICO
MTTVAIAYVALGDSYAAGVGGGPSHGACWRADAGYPVLVGRRLGLPVAYNACLGATIADVLAHHLDALGPQTSHVSITVGGNDIGFVPVLIAAAEPAWMSNSDTAIDAALITMRRSLPGRLDGLFAEVTRRAPGAQVVVSGYPALFMGEDCSPFTFFSAHEMTRLNDAADELRSIIAAATRRAGFGLARVASSFVGHAVCSYAEWINGVSWPVEASFHPNALGHKAYADLVLRAFGVAAGPGDLEPGPEAAPGDLAEPAGRESEVIEGPCIPGSAPTFALPDLLSARSLAGARSFGLDPAEVARLATVLHENAEPGMRSAPAAQAAAARLRELDRQAAAARGVAGMA